MYAEFANAEIDSRHVLTSPGDATMLAAHLQQLVQEGSILRPIDSESAHPR